MKSIAAVTNSIPGMRIASGPIARGALITSVLRILNIGLGFFTTLVLARMLGAEGYGVFAFGTGVAMLAALFPRLGVQVFVAKQTATLLETKDWSRLAALERFALVGSFFGVGLGAVAASAFFWASEQNQFLIFAGLAGALIAPALAITAAAQGRLRGQMKMSEAYAPEFAIAPTATLCIVALLAFVNELTPKSALIAFGAGWFTAAMGALIFLQQNRPHAAVTPAKIEWPVWFAGAVVIGLASIISVSAGRLELMVLGTHFDAAEIGVYAIAYRFAVFTTFPGFALASGLGPVLAKLHATNDNAAIQRRIHLSTIANAAGSVGAALAIAVAGWIVLPYLSADLVEARPCLAVMCVGYAIQSLAGRPGDILTMTDRAPVAAKASAITLAISFCAMFLIIPKFGALGAAMVTGITVVFHAVLLATLVARSIGIRCDVLAAIVHTMGRRALK